MDQEKIGKFIAACRKEKGFTQASLAEKLGITDRAVSKWETGKSLPDASIMMELCELIGTNVNELLTGERIALDEYTKKAEQSLIEMQAKAEKADRNLLRMEIVMGIIIIPLCIILTKISEIFINQGDALTGYALLVISYIAIVLFGIMGMKIEHDAGYYECPNCGERYVPSMLAVLLAIHVGTARRLKCPYCEKRGFHKKVVSKKKG
ncbi:MAG: helix-turn-helix transcriptional regulator [Lachnospiraceae bacterium]|jgi:transcriptional regulator with XRE-family HTH domain|nr:helix-turn-helix transcriptional regulator [Lachnospiraceae bacterium]